MANLFRTLVGVCIGIYLLSCVSAQGRCRPGCQPPECSCPRFSYPMDRREIPQIVYFGFDDAVNVVMSALYNRIFTEDRKNPNGCTVKMTLFVSNQYTDYKLVKGFHQKGHEIAVHSVTHTAIDTEKKLRLEARQQKHNIVQRAGVPAEEVVGWRSPFLKPAGNSQPVVLKELGYEYDISFTYSRPHLDVPKPWPFTMDRGWRYRCGVRPCPTAARVPGFWAVPVVSLMDHQNKYPCSFVDGCAVRATNEDEAFKFLMDNFLSYYNTTRTPFGLNMHAAWFYTRYNLKAMQRFLDVLGKMDDVYVVTVKQMLDWMKHPTPLSDIHTLDTWGCEASRKKQLKEVTAAPTVPPTQAPPAPLPPARLQPARIQPARLPPAQLPPARLPQPIPPVVRLPRLPAPTLWEWDKMTGPDTWRQLVPQSKAVVSATNNRTTTSTQRPITRSTSRVTTTRATTTRRPITTLPTTTTQRLTTTTTRRTTTTTTRPTTTTTRTTTARATTTRRPITTRPTTTQPTTQRPTTTTRSTTTTIPTTTPTTQTTTISSTTTRPTTTRPTTQTTTPITTTRPTTTRPTTSEPTTTPIYFTTRRQTEQPSTTSGHPHSGGHHAANIHATEPKPLASTSMSSASLVSRITALSVTSPPLSPANIWRNFFMGSAFNNLSAFNKNVCVQGRNCKLPSCYCQGNAIPNNMNVKDTPQLVYLTIDGNVNLQVYRRYMQFMLHKTNPNGCQVRGTIFASGLGTTPDVMKRVSALGAEIAMQGLHEHHYDSTAHLESELVAQMKALAKSNITVEGWKTPELKAMGDDQYGILQSHGLKYDATISENIPKVGTNKPWPYTLDFSYHGDCNIPKCPSKKFPGFWIVPTNSVIDYRKFFECNYIDGCMFNPPTVKDTENFLWDNFHNNYKTNRAPFGIHLRQAWFTHPAYKSNLKGLQNFIKRLLTMNDVYLVSAGDIITWMQNPVKVQDITDTVPWNCKKT